MKVICSGCGSVIAVKGEESLMINHKRRKIEISISTGEAMVSISCERCGFKNEYVYNEFGIKQTGNCNVHPKIVSP